MGEISKPIRFINYAALAAIALQGDRYVPEHAKPHEKIAAQVSEVPTSSFRNPDILDVCRQQDGDISSSCAIEQTRQAIEEADSVTAGIWQYHISDPTEQRVIDELEFRQAVQAAQAQKYGDCAAWSYRVDSPDLFNALPDCM